MRTLKGILRDCSGAMTVEFVAITPMLLVALAFAFEFGRLLWAYDVMTRDVRAGVRYLSRSQTSVSGTCPTSVTNFTKTGLSTGVQANAHYPWKDAWATASFTCAQTSFGTGFNLAVNVATMTAQVPVSVPFLDVLNRLTGTTLNASYTLQVQDQARLVGN